MHVVKQCSPTYDHHGRKMAIFGVSSHGRWDSNIAQAQFGVHVDNIIKKFREASPETVESGTHWYERAQEEAVRVGSGNMRKGAGVIAALSPLTLFDRNVAQAHTLRMTGKIPDALIPANVVKAKRIMAGEDPDDVLGGHKVRSFFENIHDPSNTEPVTIDRHAHDIALGHPFVGMGGADPRGDGDKMSPDLGLRSYGRYHHFVHAYKMASQQLDIKVPNQTQAITWATHRGAN